VSRGTELADGRDLWILLANVQEWG
jgi:hypothetical protein